MPKPKSKTSPSPTPLPPGAEGLLDKWAIMAALKIRSKKFSTMLSTGEFPKPDLRIGILNRWRVGTLNAWIESEAKRQTGKTPGGKG